MTHTHRLYDAEHPIIGIVADLLHAAGATTRADAEPLLPAVEAEQGPLTCCERAAVLARFPETH